MSRMFAKADPTDLNEGMIAYERYHIVMRRLSEKYGFTMGQVCAVFCSLSPNSDYAGNLRSTVSVLQGINERRPDADIVVSTYRHCMLRAISYARGHRSFIAETKGPKIINFYHNILTPHSQRWVTIDGHMVAIWRNTPKATMRQSLCSKREYEEIAQDCKGLAFRNFMLPQQMQAILWFARKRSLNVKYDPQHDLFADQGDAWKTARNVDDIRPYLKRDAPAIKKMLQERSEQGGFIL